MFSIITDADIELRARIKSIFDDRRAFLNDDDTEVMREAHLDFLVAIRKLEEEVGFGINLGMTDIFDRCFSGRYSHSRIPHYFTYDCSSVSAEEKTLAILKTIDVPHIGMTPIHGGKSQLAFFSKTATLPIPYARYKEVWDRICNEFADQADNPLKKVLYGPIWRAIPSAD